MQIIKETDRRVARMQGYQGSFDGCGVFLEYEGDLNVVKIEATEERFVFIPLDILSCPNCSKTIMTIKIYRNMEVSGEFSRSGDSPSFTPRRARRQEPPPRVVNAR